MVNQRKYKVFFPMFWLEAVVFYLRMNVLHSLHGRHAASMFCPAATLHWRHTLVLFIESAESSSDKQRISKRTQYICRDPHRIGGGGKAIVNMDCQGMPGGAFHLFAAFYQHGEWGENAAMALCKCCVFRWRTSLWAGCLWTCIIANNRLRGKTRERAPSSNKVIFSMTT